MAEDKKIDWPGWRTVRLIGRGSFGAVHEIQREIRGRVEHAALKVISIPQNDNEIHELRADGYDNESITRYYADSRERIEDEYAMMADLKGHSNVVYCDDIRTVQHNDGFGWDIYIKMELLTPLKSSLGSSIADAQVVSLGMDICDALKLCEELNIVHRDIKPENIFISRNGNFKLGDFGIARTMEGTTGGTKTGTYDYMAPEVYNNRPYHTQADIYSLGLVMYWLLNNRTAPFLPQSDKRPTPSAKMIARDRRFSGEKIPAPKNGSKELQEIVLKACAFDPKDRYQSAGEMREALARLSGGHIIIPDPEPVPDDNANPDYDDNETVWSSFDTVSADDSNESDNQDETVVQKNPVKPHEKRKQEQTHKNLTILWCLLGVAVFILVILLRSNNNKPQAENDGHQSIPETVITHSNAKASNVLMADHGYDASSSVFGSEITRGQIKTITFLDTLMDVPDTAWDVSEKQNDHVLAWVESNGGYYDLYIAGDGGVLAEDCNGLFAAYENLETIDFNNCFDTSSVTDMSYMFDCCEALISLDLSSFDTSSVRDMSYMFRLCESLTELDLSGFITSNVRDMSRMFYGCRSLAALDVSSFFDISRAVTIEMFAECPKLSAPDFGAAIPQTTPPTQPPTQPPKAPSEEDVVPFGAVINYPDVSAYLPSYETMYVKAPKGHSIYVYWDPNGGESYRRKYLLYEGDEVTELARQEGFSCVIFISKDGKRNIGWVNSDCLVSEYTG